MLRSQPLFTNFPPRPGYLNQSREDAALVRRCLDGDRTAFEPLVERYQQVLFTVAFRMLGNYDEARDAAQNTFVKVYEKLNAFDPEYSFFSWIYRILINDCINLRRRPAAEQIDDEWPADGPAADSMELAEQRRDVRAAILTLSPEYREVIVLRHFAGMSYDEMSHAVGVPAKTVKSRLFTARKQLAERLSAWVSR